MFSRKKKHTRENDKDFLTKALSRTIVGNKAIITKNLHLYFWRKEKETYFSRLSEKSLIIGDFGILLNDF